MLSYRHGFHAGNFADVFKHLVLSLLIQSQLRKNKPFYYLDTHGGSGRYDLNSGMARKNREYESGIGRLWQEKDIPAETQGYFEAVRHLNPQGALNSYPGSPCLTRFFMRAGDRMDVCDLHSTEASALKTLFAKDSAVKVHAMDGYQALKALLPPRERRGVVLIDPAFELKDERERLLEALKQAYKRWSTGIYAVWYPIQDKAALDWFHRQLARSGIAPILCTELTIHDQYQPLRLNGSGLIIINPPWQLDQQLEAAGPWLLNKLAPEGKGSFKQKWLAHPPERLSENASS